MVGHSTGGGEVTRYLGRHGSKRVSKAVLISSVPPLMLEDSEQPRRRAEAFNFENLQGLSARYARDQRGPDQLRLARVLQRRRSPSISVTID